MLLNTPQVDKLSFSCSSLGMSKVLLVVKKGLPLPKGLEEDLREILLAHGFELTKDQKEEDLSAIIVLGGDGTFLRSAPLAYERDIPLLGINFGRLGFLTEVTLEEAFKAVEALARGEYQIEERFLLQVCHRGEEFLVLNEAAILKGPLGHMIHLEVEARGKLLTIYHGDGLILATPTGSTAYNLSAGGPIVYPTCRLIILTPICPFMLSARPIVIPGDFEVRARLKREAEEVHLILDGHINRLFNFGEEICFRPAPRPLKFVRSPTRDYFGILRAKLGWGYTNV